MAEQPGANVVVLSQNLIRGIASKPELYQQVPEFNALKAVLVEASKPAQSVGCCQKRRKYESVYQTFSDTLASLQPDAVARFKKVAGIDALVVRGFNRKTGAYELRKL